MHSAVENQLSSLFPLPLVPLEKFLLWDDRVDNPMCMFVELHFSTALRMDALKQAISTAVHRNPLLSCRLATIDGELHWQYVEDPTPNLFFEEHYPTLDCGMPRPFDLENELGCRFWYREQADGQSRVLIQCHHAICDGYGLRRVTIDILTQYAEQTDPPDAAVRFKEVRSRSVSKVDKLDIELLRRRHDFESIRPKVDTISKWQRIKNAWYFHIQLPRPLPGNADEGTLPSNCEPLRQRAFDKEFLERVTEKAQKDGFSLNDVAIACLFWTCARWYEKSHSRGRKYQRKWFGLRRNDRIRVLMPFDLRSRIDLRMPAANRFSFAFLGRPASQCADVATLLPSVKKEIESIKQTMLPLDFLDAVAMAATNPRLTKWLIKRRRNMATVALTYTGDFARGLNKQFPEVSGSRLVGDTRLTNILVAPPSRDNTSISLGLFLNMGQLYICATWNRKVFSANDAEAFLRLYETAWKEWLGCPDVNHLLVEATTGVTTDKAE